MQIGIFLRSYMVNFYDPVPNFNQIEKKNGKIILVRRPFDKKKTYRENVREERNPFCQAC